jgi:hypothetical protein
MTAQGQPKVAPRATEAHPSAAARRFATLATVSIAVCTLDITLLHILPGGRTQNPWSTPISDYAFTRVGWLFDAAVIVMALGLTSLLCSLVVGGWIITRSAAFVVLAVCCLGLVAVVIFPYSTSEGAPTTNGWMHWIAAMATFAGVSVSPALLGHRRDVDSDCSRIPRLADWLSVAAGGWFAVLFVGSVLQWATSLPIWRVGGAVERGLGVTEMFIAIVLAAWVRKGCSCRRLGHTEAARPRARQIACGPTSVFIAATLSKDHCPTTVNLNSTLAFRETCGIEPSSTHLPLPRTMM